MGKWVKDMAIQEMPFWPVQMELLLEVEFTKQRILVPRRRHMLKYRGVLCWRGKNECCFLGFGRDNNLCFDLDGVSTLEENGFSRF